MATRGETKTIVCVALVILIISGIIFVTVTNGWGDGGSDKDGAYYRTATYFGNDYPQNFWNSEMDNLDEDFERIKEDGFNSILIVVPWREFQPTTSPITYNDYAFDKLREVMDCADNNGLDVFVRVGYTWDYYEDLDDNVINRFWMLLGDQLVKKAWQDYCTTLYDVLSSYDNFAQGFIVWEDFWNVFGICNLSEEDRLFYSSFSSYSQYIQDNYLLERYNEEFDTNYKTYSDIPIPMTNEPAFRSMYEWVDCYLNDLLDRTNDVFPNLSMEVRMDVDVYYDKFGEVRIFNHTSTYPCDPSMSTFTMYGVPMGFENKGERVTAQDTIIRFEYMMDLLKEGNNGKPVYIDQFIFYDNTPEFSHNARLLESEIGPFLEASSEVLLHYTYGYAIWTYVDYKSTVIYNSQFALAERGWGVSGEVSFLKHGKTMVASLKQGGAISQEIPFSRGEKSDENVRVSFDVTTSEEAQIIVTINSISKLVDIQSSGTYEISFGKEKPYGITIECAKGSVLIDNVCCYNHIQNGLIYDVYGEKGPALDYVRFLNKILSDSTILIKE